MLVLQFKVLTSRLGAHSYIYCQRYGDVNVSEFSLNKLIMHLRVIQQQATSSIFHTSTPLYFISFSSLLGRPGMNAFRECDVKNIQKCQGVCSCLVLFVLGMPCSGWSSNHDAELRPRRASQTSANIYQEDLTPSSSLSDGV